MFGGGSGRKMIIMLVTLVDQMVRCIHSHRIVVGGRVYCRRWYVPSLHLTRTPPRCSARHLRPSKTNRNQSLVFLVERVRTAGNPTKHEISISHMSLFPHRSVLMCRFFEEEQPRGNNKGRVLEDPCWKTLTSTLSPGKSYQPKISTMHTISFTVSWKWTIPSTTVHTLHRACCRKRK